VFHLLNQLKTFH